ncbi:DUF2860 family protein [Enterovibrio nigricans]|uniref:DUF2860 domain-containing protein n=1 Tax=Enterovibrio nigricans DSM 22720 TaxID=1121868 RepID=A0A1T4UT28_9GAMM|nr:DUF2860 family protein [Enterovibrio nigricans]PKF50801.1 DUF2860 domain-containing protein [Enterovibrio nigricans]SKA55765.1 Protein of unknown function [Enterovibrio nigricans DSM 22720]
MKTTLLLACFSILPFSTHASLAERGGLTGEISVLGGIASTDSNLSTSANNTKTGTLNTEGNRENDAIFGPLGSAKFTFGEGLNKQIFAGTSREDIAIGIVALEVGYKQELASGTQISLSYLPTLLAEDVWADPFLIGSPRTETEKTGNAYRLQFNRIGGSFLSLDMAYAQTEFDDEQSGSSLGLTTQQQQTLARKGDSFYSKISYRQFLGKGLGITPAFVYLKHDADGDAMSHQTYGGELTYFSFLGRNKIVLTGSFNYRDYEAVNPAFGIKRADTEYSAFLAYEYAHLFEIHPLSLVSLAGYSHIDSNIDFYTESQYLLSLGVTYRF